MFKYAAVFLVVSLAAGVLGLVELPVTARRVALALFALFFALFLGASAMVWMSDEPLMPGPSAQAARPMVFSHRQPVTSP
jgi:uncharacterized membrane protein YtjA (UPF0391 family)